MSTPQLNNLSLQLPDFQEDGENPATQATNDGPDGSAHELHSAEVVYIVTGASFFQPKDQACLKKESHADPEADFHFHGIAS